MWSRELVFRTLTPTPQYGSVATGPSPGGTLLTRKSLRISTSHRATLAIARTLVTMTTDAGHHSNNINMSKRGHSPIDTPTAPTPIIVTTPVDIRNHGNTIPLLELAIWTFFLISASHLRKRHLLPSNKRGFRATTPIHERSGRGQDIYGHKYDPRSPHSSKLKQSRDLTALAEGGAWKG